MSKGDALMAKKMYADASLDLSETGAVDESNKDDLSARFRNQPGDEEA
jgi:hypothetical protein